MSQRMLPSIAWRESIAADEEQRYARAAQLFTEIQQRKSQRYGTGRTLHRKQIVAAQGTLEVLDSLPEYARQGLFIYPHDYEVWVRLSNGGFDKVRDSRPDIRGFAIRVFGVQGESALGNGPAISQDFTLINQESFGFVDSTEFIDLAVAASQGNGKLIKYLFRRYGLAGAPRQLAKMLKMAGRPFSGFATEMFHSAAPMANGPYAARVRLVPAVTNGKRVPGARQNWARDFGERLAQGPLHWDMQLQFYVDESTTPIEDASVNWPVPYTTVARLMLPRQDTTSPEGQDLNEQVEATVIDPWQALAAHRPLGDVQRARKVVYFASQQGRGAV